MADASHELQTPLTSVRGYAELFRRGAAQRPDDLATTMRRIEAEATRMGVLVDDLLLLARLDQGRPMDAERLDLTALVGRPGGRRARGRARPPDHRGVRRARSDGARRRRCACARWSATC